MEKQEARSLRVALEDMDLKDEHILHEAAQDEAAELVWRHQNPAAALAKQTASYTNPDIVAKTDTERKDYKSHMRKGSYQRSHSQEGVPTLASTRSSSDTRPSMESTARRVSPPTLTVNGPQPRPTSSISKSYGHLASAVASDIASAHRRISSGSRRILSGEKKKHMNRHDRIYEDPVEEATPPEKQQQTPSICEDDDHVVTLARPAIVPVQPPKNDWASVSVRKNPFARVRAGQDKLVHSVSAPVLPVVAKHHSIEIQRNAPSQSRKAWYTSNTPVLPPPSPIARDNAVHEESEPVKAATPTKNEAAEVKMKDGKEIRSDELRAATSKQRKDRSPKLPIPMVVSDKVGRPIVSFEAPVMRDIVLEEVKAEQIAKPSFNPEPLRIEKPKGQPQSRHQAPPPSIPIINLPDDDYESTLPTIVLPEEPEFASTSTLPSSSTISSFSFFDTDLDTQSSTAVPSRRPLPTPAARPLPHHAATSPIPLAHSKSTPHFTPSLRASGVLCAHCALPIAGRILSAGGERFHPACFVCHRCHTNLELVAFYPEPESDRQQDDDSPRFYCHLDYHELFSPRCKTCSTPIEGTLITALGGQTYHPGHFFCAQCGDPFQETTPFVEREGYAWCVGCHANRFSAKCRGCRKPVVEGGVQALGSEWHEKCFGCLVSGSDPTIVRVIANVRQECSGQFEDGRYFLRGESQDPVCVRCEEKRLKA